MKYIGNENKLYLCIESRIGQYSPSEPVSVTFWTSFPKLAIYIDFQIRNTLPKLGMNKFNYNEDIFESIWTNK